MILEFFCDRLGMIVGKVYRYMNMYDEISLRLEDDLIKLTIMGYGVEIPMFENLAVFANMLMTFCFDWMEAAWKYAFPQPGEVPDMRDIKEDAGKMIERQKELYDQLKPVNYRCCGK